MYLIEKVFESMGASSLAWSLVTAKWEPKFIFQSFKMNINFLTDDAVSWAFCRQQKRSQTAAILVLGPGLSPSNNVLCMTQHWFEKEFYVSLPLYADGMILNPNATWRRWHVSNPHDHLKRYWIHSSHLSSIMSTQRMEPQQQQQRNRWRVALLTLIVGFMIYINRSTDAKTVVGDIPLFNAPLNIDAALVVDVTGNHTIWLPQVIDNPFPRKHGRWTRCCKEGAYRHLKSPAKWESTSSCSVCSGFLSWYRR